MDSFLLFSLSVFYFVCHFLLQSLLYSGNLVHMASPCHMPKAPRSPGGGLAPRLPYRLDSHNRLHPHTYGPI